jgi:hypothetical protein
MQDLKFLALAGALSTAALAQVPPAPGATTQDFTHAPVTPGAWAYRPQAGLTQAYFMDSSGTIRLFVQCAIPTRTVTISRTSAAPAASLTVWTSAQQRALPARFEPNAMRVTVSVNARDTLLDAIAFSRGRIAVLMPGSAPLVIPAGPEAARVFEDCRI